VTRRVTDLIPYARNARTHSDAQVAQIAASIKEFGFTNPVLTHGDDILAGHGRVLAARKLGMATVPTIDLSHLSKTQARAYILADNQLSLNAGWEAEMLALELAELDADGFDLDLLGFPDVTGLMNQEPEGGLAPGVDEDAVPEPPKVAITKPGDIITLGRHRLMCGDCRDFSHVSALLAGVKINVTVTSPPYASQRKYDEASGFKPIPTDEYVEWYRDVAANIMANLAEDGSYFCNIKEHCEDGQRSLYVKDLTIAHVREWGWRFVDEFCWERVGLPGRYPGRFKNAFEPIFHYSKAESGDIKFSPERVGHPSDSIPVYSLETNLNPVGSMTGVPNDRETARERSSNRKTREGVALPSNRLPPFSTDGTDHSAAFPVALPEFFIKAFSDEGDAIFDPFMGSGTTLIAAEKNGRIAYGMEISPIYCDVIVARWEQATGQKAVRP
jgi:DNA modification methylase